MSSETYQTMRVGEGETVVDGKAHFKDFVQVEVNDPKEAFTIAMDILRQVESQQYSDTPRKISFSLTGSLVSEQEMEV